MTQKPWPIIVLALFHLLEPVAKVIFYSIFFGTSITSVVMAQTHNYLHFFEFFFLFPIAGLAIYKVKNWSIPIFLIVEIWNFVSNIGPIQSFYQSGQYSLIFFLVVFTLSNILLVIYFLLPAVRIAYLDPRIRWWEASPRYAKTIDLKVNEKHETQILNISETGVFAKLDENEIQTGDVLTLEFKALDTPLKVHGKAIHRFAINNVNGVGIQFVELKRSDKREIRTMMNEFERSGVERRPERRNMSEDFKHWIGTLFKTGKGLFPEVKGQRKN